MSDRSLADDLRARLDAAGAKVTPEEFDWLLSIWKSRRESWERLGREGPQGPGPSFVFRPLDDE